MRGTRGEPIKYKVMPNLASIPTRETFHPYQRITNKLAHAPKGRPVVPVKCNDEAEAMALSKRLHTFFAGQGISVRRLPGTNYVFVQPRAVRASPKRKKRQR